MYEQGLKHNKKFKITVTTNCLEVTDEQAKFFNDYGINLVLSIDGRKEVNDDVRKDENGCGTYDRIIDNIQKLVEGREDLSFFVRGTYTRNALDFSKDVKYLKDLGFKNISMEPVVLPEGDPLRIKEEDLKTVYDEYEKLTKLYMDYKAEDKGFNFFHFNLELDHGPCVHKRIAGCGAGSEYMAVSPEGDLYPCHQFVGNDEFIIGNVYTGIKNQELRKEFKETHVYTKEKCKNCFAKFLCSGGCHANAYFQNGDLKKPYELGCEIQKKRLECALYIAAKERMMKENL